MVPILIGVEDTGSVFDGWDYSHLYGRAAIRHVYIAASWPLVEPPCCRSLLLRSEMRLYFLEKLESEPGIEDELEDPGPSSSPCANYMAMSTFDFPHDTHLYSQDPLCVIIIAISLFLAASAPALACMAPKAHIPDIWTYNAVLPQQYIKPCSADHILKRRRPLRALLYLLCLLSVVHTFSSSTILTW